MLIIVFFQDESGCYFGLDSTKQEFLPLDAFKYGKDLNKTYPNLPGGVLKDATYYAYLVYNRYDIEDFKTVHLSGLKTGESEIGNENKLRAGQSYSDVTGIVFRFICANGNTSNRGSGVFTERVIYRQDFSDNEKYNKALADYEEFKILCEDLKSLWQ